MALLGIDLGTSAAKVIVLDTEGRSLSVSKLGYEVMAPHPGWAEGDPNAWWRATVSAVQAAMAQAPHARITAIGLSGQMHGVVPTDKGGRPTRAARRRPRESSSTRPRSCWPTRSLRARRIGHGHRR